MLVVTYKQIEAAFAGIPGVETGHFKAIAGLDVYKDVALLIVIGRPLPGDDDLGQLTSMYFGHVPTGGYHRVRRGLLMRDGSRRTIAALIDLTQLSDETLHELMAVLGRSQAAETIELEKDRANDRWSIS